MYTLYNVKLQRTSVVTGYNFAVNLESEMVCFLRRKELWRMPLTYCERFLKPRNAKMALHVLKNSSGIP